MSSFERFQELLHKPSLTPEERYERDLFAFTSPDVWMKWPVMPVIALDKNNPRLPVDVPETLRDSGVLIAGPSGDDPDLDIGLEKYGGRPIVYVVNLFMLSSAVLGHVPTIEYESFEALAKEWRGD